MSDYPVTSSSTSRPAHPLSASHEEDSFTSMSSDLEANQWEKEVGTNRNSHTVAEGTGLGTGVGGIGNGVGNENGNGVVGNGSALANGNGVGNGTTPLEDLDEGKFKPMFEGSSVDRREFIRLTLQSLKDLGYQ